MEAKDENRRLRILIIEDNKDLATLLCSLIELMGHIAVSANTGSAGLRIAREDKPDIILCDIGLPDVNGYDVAKQIRSEESLNDVFLVALTGYAGDRDIELAMESGFNLHLAKPLNHAALQQIISKFTGS